MPPFRSPLLASVALPLALAACGSGDGGDEEQSLQPDPAIVAALAAPIMTDPDLATMNRGNAAIELDHFDAVPGWTRDPDEIAAARAAAVRLAGGQLRSAPEAGAGFGSMPKALTASRFAAEIPGAPARCLEALRPGYAWAANMPAASALYPGSHVEEAEGTRQPSCMMRAVRYVTPAAALDVLDFHFSMLSAGGYEVERASNEGMDLLVARKGRAKARVLVELSPDGMTRVALATSL